jgi:hypothetical protein
VQRRRYTKALAEKVVGVGEVELSLMFAASQMALVDELKDRDSLTTMSFTEFLEAGSTQVAGCGVQGARCKVQGAGCRVQGTGCRVQGAGCRVRGAGIEGRGVKCTVQGAGCEVQGAR